MKTPILPIIRSVRRLFGPLRCPALLLAAGTLASCGAVSAGKTGSSPVTLQPAHWYKALDKPPTYFPKGVPADHPTTASDGMWVMTGDSSDTRYFIPVRGVDTKGLVAEALTARTPEQRKKVEKAGGMSLNPARIFGNAATGLGYTLLEVDRQAASARARQEGGRGDAGVWENKARR